MLRNSTETAQAQQKINSFIQQGHINLALIYLDEYAEQFKLNAFKSTILDIKNEYALIAKYFIEGFNDPQRAQVIDKVKNETYKLADQLFDEIFISQAQTFPYQQIKDYRYTYTIDNETIVKRLQNYADGLCERPTYEDALVWLFDKLWLTAPYNESTIELYKQVTQNLLSANEQCLAVTATGLSLWRYFEESKWALLVQTAMQQNDDMQIRALTAICFTIIRHKDKIAGNASCMELLHTLTEQTGMLGKIKTLLKQIIRSTGTAQVTEKLKTDILPELMKAGQKMQNRFKDIKLETEDDFNPAWNKINEDSDVEKKIREFGELQMSGADVYFANFAELKSHPFFNAIHRWFLPFDKRHTYIADLFVDNGKTILETFIKSGTLCNSDKYSFCLTVKQMPLQQQQMVKENLGQELEQQLAEGMDKLPAEEKWARSANQYIQDLYRFFQLYPKKSPKKDNPLQYALAWHDSLLFQENILTDNMQLEIADFIFEQRHYTAASHIYNKFKNTSPSAALYQKIGYALEKEGAHAHDILAAYEKADLLQPNDKWTLKHLAVKQIELGDYEKALHTYQQLNEIAPNEKKTELGICRCLIQLNRMEEALQMAFKVYWEHPEYQPAIFTIGDISFETSNFQQALKYWEMFLENAKTYDNIMDIGIKFWCMGEQAKGLDTLKKAKAIYENKTGNEREIFYAQLESYIPLLGQFGINETDARLLFDII